MTNHNREIDQILSIHQQDRQAHFKTDVNSAISFFDDPYYYVRDGEIHPLSPEKLEPMYANYFQGAKFYEWDDLEQPIIHISGDGNMAWVIEHFRIRLSREGEKIEQISEYAGITVYEKKSEKWLRVANASTFAKRE